MNDLIKRYIYDVVRRLPEAMKEEVSKELTSHIEEMLPENPSKEAITNVLYSLGHPRVLANEYRGNKRYLISPEWFDDYLMVLKIVMIIFGSLALVGGIISNVLNPESSTAIGIIFEVLFETIGSIIDALFNAFAIVTIIFVVIDKANKKGREVVFDVKDLPKLPDQKSRHIPQFGTIVNLSLNLILGTVFIYLMIKNDIYLVWFDGDGANLSLPLFNHDVVKPFIILFIISISFNVLLEGFKLIERQWTIRVTILHTVVKLLSAIVAIIFMTSNGLLNPDFLQELSQVIDVSTQSISDGVHGFLIFLSIMVALGSIAEIVTIWVKTVKKRNEYLEN